MGGSSLGPEVIRRSFGDDARTACGCTCSTRPTPAPMLARRARRSTSTRRCSSSPRSPAGRSRRSRTCATSTSAPAATARTSCAVTDPGSPLIDAGARARLPARVRERPGHRRALLGAVVLRARAGGADGREHRGAAAPGAGGRAELRRSTTRRGRTPGLWLGVALGELALHGRDKLTFVVSRADLELRPLGRAADRRVDRQAGQGHPAGGRRAARRRPRPTATTACSSTCATRTSRTRSWTPEIEALGAGRPPDRHARRARRRGDLGRIFFFAEFAIAVAGWVLGINPFDQPNVQEAKDNTAQGARGRRPARRGPGRRSSELLAQAGAAALRRDHGLRRRRPRSSTRRSPSCAPRSASAHEVHDHVRLRPALPALDRPVPQGRPADRPVHPARPRRRRGRRDPRRRLLVRAPEERAGDRRPADAARRTACRSVADPARRRARGRREGG